MTAPRQARIAGLDLLCEATPASLGRALDPFLSPFAVRRVHRPLRLQIEQVARRYRGNTFGTVRARDDQLECHLPNARAWVDAAGARMRVAVGLGTDTPHLEPALRLLLFLGSIARGGVPLHAAAVAVGRQAVVFCGPSGQGKTTAAQCSGGRLLQEDLVILRPQGERWVVAAAPVWSRPELPPTRRAVPLGGLLRPGPGAALNLRPLRGALATRLLFNPPGLIDGGLLPATADRLLDSCTRLAGEVRCGELSYPAPSRLDPVLRRWLEQ